MSSWLILWERVKGYTSTHMTLRPCRAGLIKALNFDSSNCCNSCIHPPGGGGGTPYNGLYGEAPPERGIFFRLKVYEKVWITS